MKKLIFLLVLFLPSFLNAQLTYYELVNKARYCVYKNDYKQALVYYKELMKVKADENFIISSMLFKDPIYWAFAANDNKMAYKLILKKVDQDISCSTLVAANKYLGDSILNKLKPTKYYKKYQKHDFHKTEAQINRYSWRDVVLVSSIFKIDFIDGETRGFNYKKWGKNIDSAELSKMVIEYYRFRDSININSLFKLVRENNNRNGFWNFQASMLNILHNIHHCNLSPNYPKSVWYYDSFVYYFKPAVLKYWYPNTMYAFLIDNANSGYCDSLQVYGTKTEIVNGVSIIRKGIIDIDNVDKRRAEIGLPTLYESSLYKKFILPNGYKIPEHFLVK